MLKIPVYLLAAVLGLFSSAVSAEGEAYQIDLLTFSQTMPNTEIFEQTVSQISWPADLTELSAYKEADNKTLAASYAALSNDAAYRPILYAAWVQHAPAGGLSAPVHIQGVDGDLDGYVQIRQGQGLQMTVDLELSSKRRSGSGAASAQAADLYVGDKAVIYRLNEKRPVKLNEIYYFDHPKFGVIVKISPL